MWEPRLGFSIKKQNPVNYAAIEDSFLFFFNYAAIEDLRYCKWWSWYMQLVAIEDFLFLNYAAIEGSVSDEVDICS